MTTEENKTKFLESKISREILIINATFALFYFFVLAFLFERGNMILFYILIFGEIFHLWQALSYVYTVWKTDHPVMRDRNFMPGVDVFITVAGEPVSVVEETARAARNMNYPDFKVYILNDGFILNKENWKEIELLAKRLGIYCITRKIKGGAKAGNINNALKNTENPFFVVFDSDHIPHVDFLRKTMPYFADPGLGFLQTPQYYRNSEKNLITKAAWGQQALFFGTILKGKNRLNSVSLCGTNMVLRREAITEIGGMNENSIAEDLITGLMMHENGWKSAYHPEVLAEGLAPEDLWSYHNQQFRWARGSFDIIFSHNFLFSRKLTLAQKIQYFSSVSFFFSGLVIAMNAALPLVYFFLGIAPLTVSTMWLAAIFLPYIFVTMYILQRTSNFTFSFRALALSMCSFAIHIKAVIAAVLGKKSKFIVTPKESLSGNFLHLAIPHIFYILIAVAGIVYGFMRDGFFSPSLINNIAWTSIYIIIFKEFIVMALPPAFSLSSFRLFKKLVPERKTVNAEI